MATPTITANNTGNNGSSASTVGPTVSYTANASDDIIVVCTFGFATSSRFDIIDIEMDTVGGQMTKRVGFVATAAFEQSVSIWFMTSDDVNWPGVTATDYVQRSDTGENRQHKTVVFSAQNVDLTTPFAENGTGVEGDEVGEVSDPTTISVTSDMLLMGASNSFDGNYDEWNSSSGTELVTIQGTGSDASVWYQTGSGSTMTAQVGVDDAITDFAMIYFVLQDTPAPAGGNPWNYYAQM